MNCIDISSIQTVDWQKVPADITRVIVRTILQSGNADPKAVSHIKGALQTGRIADGYKYSYALTADDIKNEFTRVISLLDKTGADKGTTTIWADMEWKKQRQTLSRQQITDLVKKAAEVVQESGYQFGVYCNLDWYKNVLYADQLPFQWWIARYPLLDTGTLKEKLRPNVGETIWQYSSKGKVNGVSGYVDLNHWMPAEKEIYILSVADVFTKEDAESFSQYLPQKIGRNIHHVDVGGLKLWCVSIADVSTEIEAYEAMDNILTLYPELNLIRMNVHKVILL